jgi:hypothetical protein
MESDDGSKWRTVYISVALEMLQETNVYKQSAPVIGSRETISFVITVAFIPY